LEQKTKILVLDDEEVVCSRLKPALEKAGYDVETFTDSRLAKERLDHVRFDIIVTDLKMADIDGMDLSMFAKERWPDTEVIIISGFATVDVARKAMKAGVRDVIAKPFRIRELKELIDKIAAEINRLHGE
jgi:DNA-binding NtrC family response regulator